jgi:hypothetical protein
VAGEPAGDAPDAQQHLGRAHHRLEAAGLQPSRQLPAAADPKWDHSFDEQLEIPFAIDTRNLSFVNTSTSLIHAGAMLAALDGHGGAGLGRATDVPLAAGPASRRRDSAEDR